MEFTEEELFEIEKMCDIQASQLAVQFGQVITDMSKLSKQYGTIGIDKFATALVKDYSDSYDTLRTISAKVASMRKKVK